MLKLRLLSYIVMAYMLMAFTWRALLLFSKNKEIFYAKRDLLEVGLNMKNVELPVLVETCPPGGMCTHKIRIEKAEDIMPAVFGWIRVAYECLVRSFAG